MDAKAILVPTLKLTVIGVIITALLFMTNSRTQAKIEQNEAQAAVEARKQVLPEADDFEEKKVTVNGTEYTYYEATNKAGYVFSGSNKGYGGQVVTMTGIDADGKIVGVLVTDASNETPGLGAKWLATDQANQDRLAQFYGDVPDSDYAVTKDGGKIQAVSGATLTSRAVTADVNSAIAQYKAATGGAN